MNWFIHLSTFKKMMVGFGLLGLITAGVGWYGVSQLDLLSVEIGTVYKNQLAPLAALSEIQDDLQHLSQDSYKMFAPIEEDTAKETMKEIGELDARLLERVRNLKPALVSADEKASLERFFAALEKYQQNRKEVDKLQMSNDKLMAFDVMKKKAGPAYDEALSRN